MSTVGFLLLNSMMVGLVGLAGLLTGGAGPGGPASMQPDCGRRKYGYPGWPGTRKGRVAGPLSSASVPKQQGLLGKGERGTWSETQR